MHEIKKKRIKCLTVKVLKQFLVIRISNFCFAVFCFSFAVFGMNVGSFKKRHGIDCQAHRYTSARKKDVASLDDDVFVTLLYMRCYFKRCKEELIPENVLNL